MMRNNSKSSIRTYHALDVVLSILQKMNTFNPCGNPMKQMQFLDEENGTRRNEVACPGPLTL